jgi:hypothetical protein
MPIIKLSRHAELQLTAWNIATNGKEFSGLGLIEKEGDVFHVVDVFLMGVGSEMYTEFNSERQRALGNDPRLKLWFHKHPIGSGNPGDPGNWSGTDEHTATQEPMGVHPELVQWSVAIVRTPGGWVGRIDIHVPKPRTFHCAVEPRFPTPETVEEATTLITPELTDYVQVLLAEFEAMRRAKATYPRQSRYYSYYEGQGVDNWSYDQDEVSGYFCVDPDCQSAPLTSLGVEYASANVELEFYECPNCGQIYYQVTDDGDALQIGAHIQPKQQPAWRQSFMNFWKGRR